MVAGLWEEVGVEECGRHSLNTLYICIKSSKNKKIIFQKQSSSVYFTNSQSMLTFEIDKLLNLRNEFFCIFLKAYLFMVHYKKMVGLSAFFI